MKTFNWNIGIIIIGIGYLIRGSKAVYKPYKIHELFGVKILQFGYFLRGDIPQKTWWWVSINAKDIIFYTSLVVFMSASFYGIIYHIMHPDMTEFRLFIELWRLYGVEVITGLLMVKYK